MNIYSGKEHDVLHSMESSGSYEWWYFDAESDNGDWVVTVIYFVGIPMSPYYLIEFLSGEKALAVDNIGIVVSIYHKGKRVGYSFIHGERNQLGFNQESNLTYKLNIGLSELVFDGKEYKLDIDTSSETWDYQSIRCSLSFKPKYLLPEQSIKQGSDSSQNESAHTWVLVAPDCDVHGEIILNEHNSQLMQIPFKGRGYHDHNFGLRPLHIDWNEWYWGRIYADDMTIIFYITPQHASSVLPIAENIRTIIVCKDGKNENYSIDSSNFDKTSFNLFGLKHNKKIVLNGTTNTGKTIVLEISSDTIMENAPFYMRSRIKCAIQSNDITHSNYLGVMELYSPQKLLNPVFRSMVRTPFRKQTTSV